MRLSSKIEGMTDRARELLAAAMIVSAPLLTVLTYLVCRDGLPETIAGRFDWFFPGWRSGVSAGGSVVASVSSVVPALGVALFLVARGKSETALGTALIVFWFSALEVGALLVSYGAETYADIEQHWWQGAVALWVSFLAAVALERVLPPSRTSIRMPPKTDLGLGPHERVVWVGRSSSRAFLVAAVVISAGGLAVMTVSGSFGVLLLIVALFAFWARSTSVRIDDAGLHVHVGPFGRRGFDVPLERIARAKFRQLSPFDMGDQGGWGYHRGRSVILRRGEGIVVECNDRPAIAITVDGAREAVDVLNALVVRSRANAGEPAR